MFHVERLYKMAKSGMGSHENTTMKNDEWLTPQYILRNLGEFTLDPCAPVNKPWRTAEIHYTKEDDGLLKDWFGRVWCNPPYGRYVGKWLEKLALHGNGIALIFARTETKVFFDQVWNKADSLFFIEGRISFCTIDGNVASMNAGAPSVLVAYGKPNSDILRTCGLKGKFINLNKII